MMMVVVVVAVDAWYELQDYHHRRRLREQPEGTCQQGNNAAEQLLTSRMGFPACSAHRPRTLKALLDS